MRPTKARITFSSAGLKFLISIALIYVGVAFGASAAPRTSSLSFDGANSYALFANQFFQGQTLTNWSVEMWFKTRNILGGNRAAQNLWQKSGFWKDVWISFQTNGTIACNYSYPSPQTYWAVVSGAGVVKNLTWHHVAVVMNGTNLQLYVDGANVASALVNGLVNWAQDSGGASTGLNMVGQEQDGNFGTNDRFNGVISEFRLWNKALGQAEIQNNMNVELVPANHPELVGYWPMGEGSGSTATDLVSANTLTLHANAGWTNDPPPIYQIEYCSPHAARATANLYNGFVVGATVTDGGCGYTNPPLVLIQGGGGSGAAATAVISNGVVTAINIMDAGSGYTSTPSIVIGSPPFVPTVSISISKVKVTQHVVLGRNYVLESSTDLRTWTATGPQFTAQSETIVSEFDVDMSGRFFRIRQVP